MAPLLSQHNSMSLDHSMHWVRIAADNACAVAASISKRIAISDLAVLSLKRSLFFFVALGQ